MSIATPSRVPPADSADAWIDAAKARAARLRREAIEDFWRAAEAMASRALRALSRRADRLVRRPARHPHTATGA